MPTTSLANEERSKKDIRSMLTRVDDFRVLQEQLLAGVAHSHHQVRVDVDLLQLFDERELATVILLATRFLEGDA